LTGEHTSRYNPENPPGFYELYINAAQPRRYIKYGVLSMINEDCDKHIKKAKYGVFIICFNILLVVIEKNNYFPNNLIDIFTTVILIILAISFIAITILINPYLTCLSKYKSF
jgi:hypothetical protein